jgi:plasmid replication initiation protein
MEEREVVHLEDIDPEKTAKALIVKHNDLVNARYQSFTLAEQRVILILLAQIRPDDEDFKDYRISLNDFSKIIGMPISGSFYENVKATCDKLTDRKIHIQQGNSWLITHWVSSAKYVHGSGYVELSFDPKLKPYLLRLKDHFTEYKLDIAVKFKSQYSIRLYEVLKKEAQIESHYRHKKQFEKKYSVDDLRIIFAIDDNQYKLFKDFRIKVLEPAIKDISDKTDLNIFETRYIKTSKKITAISFTVIIRSENEAQAQAVQMQLAELPKETLSEEENHQIIDTLINLGFTFENARSCKNKYGVRRIERNISYVQGVEKTSKKPIERLPAYLSQAIQEDWGKATEDKKERDEAKRRQEQEAKEREERENERKKAEQRKQTEQAINSFFGLPVGLRSHIQEEFVKVLKSEKKYAHLVPKWEVLRNEKEALMTEPMLGYVFSKFLDEKNFI